MTTRRAMTLLELLVAVTILASLTTLAASLWGQMRSWTEDNRQLREAMRADRVGRFLSEQWGSRTTLVRLDEGDDSGVWVERWRIDFICAEPALHPDWPLVQASILVEPSGAPGVGQDVTYDLVYEEKRLSGASYIDEQEGDGLVAPREDPGRMPLLENCAELVIERFEPAQRRRDDAEWIQASSVPGNMTRAEARKAMERGLIEKKETPRAIRLRGVANGDDFQWVFLVRASR